MQRLKNPGKDLIGAVLIFTIGVAVMAAGYSYHLGTPLRMGPGLMPFSLGALMATVGILIGVTAGGGAPRALLSEHVQQSEGGQWRGWLCILGGIVAFVILGQYGGLIPASFAAVFISALGDREGTVKSAVVLAAAMTVFAALIFHYGLQLQLPLFQWR